ncbi:MAG TPA: alpha/beta hydrolase [Acidimicrobiales bacterium]|nr:alpha/beta hydrolase [Acidimicrobiales bacterium]
MSGVVFLTKDESVQTDVGAVKLSRGGGGRPVLWLHSAMGEAADALTADLVADFTVAAPYFPGFSGSEGIEQIEDMEDAVYHLLDLMDRLQMERPIVAGLSLGGWMAAELAVRYPDSVSGLVIANPAGLYIEGHPIGEIFGRSTSEIADEIFADTEQPLYQAMKGIGGSIEKSLSSGELPFDVVRPHLESQAAVAKLAWNPYLHNPRLRRRLNRVKVPTVVLSGTKDGLIPPAHPEAFAAEIPGARLERVEAGHMLVLERPDVIAAAVRSIS